MASHDSAQTQQDGGKTSTTQSDADTTSVEIIDIRCKCCNSAVRVPSKLTRTQIGFVLILIYVIFFIFNPKMQESFLSVLGIIATIVLWRLLCLLNDRMFPTKSEEKDLEKKSLASVTSVTEDRKDVALTLPLAEVPIVSSVDLDVPVQRPGLAAEFKHDTDMIQIHSSDKDVPTGAIEDPYKNVPRRGRRRDAAVTKREKEADVFSCFDKVISRVSYKWDDLAEELGFSRNEIKTIQISEPDNDRRCREVLYRWMNKKGREATPQILKQALVNIDELDTAGSL